MTNKLQQTATLSPSPSPARGRGEQSTSPLPLMGEGAGERVRRIPRGIRNHNPGNIEYNRANKWRGQLPHDPSVEARFCRFQSAHYGLRALAVLLKNYYRRYGLTTVNKLITRYAPSHENNTRAYVKAVSEALGVKPDEPLTLDQRTLLVLVTAIVQHENGWQPYGTTEIDVAVGEALL